MGGKFSVLNEKFSFSKTVTPTTFIFGINLLNMTQHHFYELNDLFNLNNTIVIKFPIKYIFDCIFFIVNIFCFRKGFGK